MSEVERLREELAGLEAADRASMACGTTAYHEKRADLLRRIEEARMREEVSDEMRPCRKCRMPIRYIIGPNGNAIPAQRVRTVYALVEEAGQPRLSKIEFEGEKRETWVNHFETCPYAREFSKGKKRA